MNSDAYVLIHGLRRLGLAGTIRLKLLEIGTRQRVTVRKMWRSFSETYRCAGIFTQILKDLQVHPP